MKINMKNFEGKGSRKNSATSFDGNLKIRIAILGQSDVGKSAFTVRYLTKRYIGEYKSNTDMLYQQTMKIGQTGIDIEIVDISSSAGSSESRNWSVPIDEFQRVDGFVIVYSITDRSSYTFAQDALETITSHWNLKNAPSSSLSSLSSSSSGCSSASSSHTPSSLPKAACPILLVANKNDLDHLRLVEKVEGLKTSVQYGCHFCELSVAENSPEVYTSFQNLISTFITEKKEPSKRKFSLTKMLGNLRLGKTSSCQVVTSQASVVDTDILSSSTGNSENISLTSNSTSQIPTSTFNDRCSQDESCGSNLSDSYNMCHLNSKLNELHSLKKRRNSPTIISY